MVTISGYRIGRPLYKGRRTAVYQGRRLDDEKPVIIKTLLAEHLTAENIGTLRHEYGVTRLLDLENVVHSYGLESSDDGPALILEDFGGVPLKNIIAPGGIKPDVSLNIAIQIAQALGELHQNHVIHKDIKPSNIIINPDTGQVKITDFGISSLLEREYHPDVLGGSLAYMSPEQTGRMNRAVDYRTDFYSAGVTFYEMMTGQRPFQAEDPMEWVHCHIARLPVPPERINPEIPKVVSEIILKLLSKTPEERYRSAYGLKADLERCLTALRDAGSVEYFIIGQDDISDKFQISQNLYGREEEIAALMDSFQRVCGGGPEMVLVSGYSGIGKSSIVREVHKPIVKHRGYFISGKFDQFQRTIPYACLIQAFRELVRQLLTESEESIAKWKKRLSHALDHNGQVIIDVIPEVRLLVDEHPPVQELPPAESQNRFNLVFQDFVNVFAKREHPLVMFIDDLQWADTASLKLIKQLITNVDTRHLLLIGAYRDNEVGDTHPLINALDDIRKTGVAVRHISLGPLGTENVNRLISDTLKCRPAVSRPLAKLVTVKTGGNPLFIYEFLKALYDEGRLEFDAHRGGWQWDLGRIEKTKIPEDMVELIASKIQSLPVNAQKVLSLAACIGNQFNLKTLAVVNEKTHYETAVDLWDAMQDGFIVTDGSFRLDGWEEGSTVESVMFRFIHDRVQQAALSLIEEGLRKETHRKIGSLILRNTRPEELEERIFDIVNHLNYGKELIADPEEKKELALLNLTAGKRAMASNAYEAALKCMTAGIELLADDSWHVQYEMTSSLYLKRLECEYLCGNFDTAERLFDVCLKNVRLPQEKANIYNIKIILYTHQGKYKDSVELGREALKMFGVKIPARPGRASILLEYVKSRWLRFRKRLEGRRAVGDLFNLPDMSDPDQLAVMSILNNLPAPSYYLNKDMFALVNLKMVNISLRHGNTDVSSFAYATYGMILSGVFGDFDTGFKFGELALRLNEKYVNIALKNKSPFVFYTFVTHWKRRAAPDVASLKEVFQLSLKGGDLIYAANSLLSITIKTIAQGTNLDSVLKEVNNYLDFLSRIKDLDSQRSLNIVKQMVLCLKGLTKEQSSFSDDTFDEAAQVQVMKEKNTIPLHWYYIYKMEILCVLGHHAEAFKMAVESDKMLETSLCLFYLADHYMYYSLALTALYPTATSTDKRSFRKTLGRNLRILGKWSKHCPENFHHKHALVEAEMARLAGNDGEAAKLYEQAARSARENGYFQNEAVCNELAGRFHLSRGIEVSAKAYITKAYDGYVRWGAAAKVRALKESYPDWFDERPEVEKVLETMTPPTPSTSQGTESLDMMSVIKASQAISGEIHYDRLLDKLMKIVIENAGARRGVLVLERDSGLYIEAEGTADNGASVLRSLPVDGSTVLAESIVNYSVRTHEAVVLDDAVNDGGFTHDPYIMDRAVRSVLCAPIINQGRLIGILYLENNLTSYAFTPKRVGILEALSSQIAISLENARLFDETRLVKESLQESELKFRTLAETMRAAIVIFRGEKFLYVNPAAESITGYTHDEFLRMDFSRIVHPEYLSMVREREISRQMGKPVPAQYEFKIITKNGEERWMMGTAGMIEYEGKPAAIGALLDITDHKRGEAERERLYEENVRHYQEKIAEEKRHQREKEKILMDIHDGIGGITTNISLLAEVAQKAQSPADVRRALSTISSLSREGMGEIRSLMYSLDSKDLSWHTLIAELRNQGISTVAPHDISFEMTLQIEKNTEEPGSLLCMNLFRIYREALTNVIKHSKAKRVDVNFHVGEGRLVLTVRDNGQGWDKIARTVKGRGMSNMKARAAEIGGTVVVIADKGTCVSVEIPLSIQSPGRRIGL